jgi:hypothetical protein
VFTEYVSLNLPYSLAKTGQRRRDRVVLHQLDAVSGRVQHVVRPQYQQVDVLLEPLRVILLAHVHQSLQKGVLLLEVVEDLLDMMWLPH